MSSTHRYTAIAAFAVFFGCDGNGLAQDVDEELVTGLRSQDPDVQISALAALDQHLAFGGQQSNLDVDIVPILRSLLMSAQPEVSKGAARILILYSGDKTEAAQWLIDKAGSTAAPIDGAAYILMLSPKVDSERVREELMYLATGPTDDRSFAAVEVLVGFAEPPDELLAHILRHAQDPLFYGRQSLIRGVGKYGEEALPYLPVLTQIRDKLISESLLPYEERTVNVRREGDVTNIYEDPLAITVLNEVIDDLTMLSQEPQR